MKLFLLEVSLCRLSIFGIGLGVCIRKYILVGICIGLFEGRRIWLEEVKLGMDMLYMWEVGG